MSDEIDKLVVIEEKLIGVLKDTPELWKRNHLAKKLLDEVLDLKYFYKDDETNKLIMREVIEACEKFLNEQ